ncbi:MAG: hypothetical protein E7618_06650 [Ruminococcaceae bacterium]|nr:hypothetical protein [Oscillospiraceae bacterium]
MNDTKAFRFRESFRGYHRDDVNAYIQQMSLAASRKEGELRAVIADLESQLAAVPSETSRNEEIEALNAKLQALEAENRRLQEEQQTKKTENAVSDETEKSKLYDSMSAQVGNILIVANSNAEKILADANAEAERIRYTARVEAEAIRIEAEKRMEEKIVALEAQLKVVSDECLASYMTLLSEAKVRFGEVTETIKERSAELLLKADAKSREIERKLIEPTGKPE